MKMTLKNLVNKIEKLGDKVSVILLTNNYAIGLEKFRKDKNQIMQGKYTNKDREDDIKYTLFGNHSSNQNIYSGHNAKFLSNDAITSFSFEAERLLEDFSQTLKSPIRDLKRERKNIYDKMLQPLGIGPVHKRKWSYSLPIIGMTLTYPISAPLTYLWYRMNGVKDIDGVPISIPIFYTPLDLPSAISELVSPSQKGNKITNKSILKIESDGVFPGLKFLKRENPNFFGDGSGDGEPYLDLVFPDGLELCRGNAFYPKDKNHYDETEYFLPVKSNLRKNLYLSVEQTNNKWKMWREFRDSVSKGDIEKIVKKHLS